MFNTKRIKRLEKRVEQLFAEMLEDRESFNFNVEANEKFMSGLVDYLGLTYKNNRTEDNDPFIEKEAGNLEFVFSKKRGTKKGKKK